MRLASVILLCLLFWVCSSSVFRRPPGAGPTGDFRDNPQYAEGELVDLQWDSTDDSAIDLTIIQVSEESEPASATLFLGQQTTRWTWRVGFHRFWASHDRDLSNVYYLVITPAGQGGAGSTSHYFNITRNAASSGPSSSLSSVLSPAATSTATNIPKPSDDAGLSGGAVAGLAIGATFGTLVVVGIVGFLIWRCWKHGEKRKRAVAAGVTATSDTSEVHLHKRDTSGPSGELCGESTQRFETEGSEPRDLRFEMSADTVRRGENVILGQGGESRY
ncbi:hypothetical protein CORC01_05630 [Colletotrichum orchidophilum]|uniref:Mid2 domain-containing protein n=1 Tax=Colletotrichum orchidophilum TaxID=1209926 RepID=A0A1G4BCP4_9PEZI|nr:uncharacterized protein CORC01_05630 [Colletotrichum orchidophilum]OHE99137.1 hypothetical protein CORC01_05630 [Colletotrichum orchidophilum]